MGNCLTIVPHHSGLAMGQTVWRHYATGGTRQFQSARNASLPESVLPRGRKDNLSFAATRTDNHGSHEAAVLGTPNFTDALALRFDFDVLLPLNRPVFGIYEAGVPISVFQPAWLTLRRCRARIAFSLTNRSGRGHCVGDYARQCCCLRSYFGALAGAARRRRSALVLDAGS